MKSKRLTIRFLVLGLLAAGAFSVLSVQDVRADGWFCEIDNYSCWATCNHKYTDPNDPDYGDYDKWYRCTVVCDVNEQACLSYGAWQSWLIQYNGNINDPFMIENGPDPVCAMYPDIIAGCGGLPTAEEIEVCVMMAQQEQARYRCP
jgi:hypothetical protein